MILIASGKCSDLGFYELQDENGKTIKSFSGYGPHGLGVGGGDYIKIKIDLSTGKLIDFKPVSDEAALKAFADATGEDDDDDDDFDSCYNDTPVEETTEPKRVVRSGTRRALDQRIEDAFRQVYMVNNGFTEWNDVLRSGIFNDASGLFCAGLLAAACFQQQIGPYPRALLGSPQDRAVEFSEVTYVAGPEDLPAYAMVASRELDDLYFYFYHNGSAFAIDFIGTTEKGELR